MASQQAQGPDPIRSRSGHIGALTKQYNAIDFMITGSASQAEAIAAQKALHHRYTQYLESHELALAAIAEPESLTSSHTSTVDRYSKYCDIILTYIETLEVSPAEPTPHSNTSLQATKSSPSLARSSKSSNATVVAASSSRKSQSVRSTRSQTTRRSSQVSKSSSAKLSEARVQAELAKKQMGRMKDLQDLKLQKDEMEMEAERKKRQLAATIALTEHAHKIQALEEEVELREREVVREELGSDFESEDEERPDVTQASKSVLSDRAAFDKRRTVERWIEETGEDEGAKDKPMGYSEMSVENRLKIERRLKEAFNLTQVSATLPAAQTQVTLTSSVQPVLSTSVCQTLKPSTLLPTATPYNPVIPKSRALVVGKEVPATGSFPGVQNQTHQVTSSGWTQTVEEQQDDMAKILDAINKKQMESTPLQLRSGYCPPRNTPHKPRHSGYDPSRKTARHDDDFGPFDPSPVYRSEQLHLPTIQEESVSSDVIVDPTQAALQVMSEAMLRLDLPKRSQMTFDGNPKQYRLFTSSFKHNIENKVSDPSLRLSYLIDCCSGDAHDLIVTCVELSPEDGYREAQKRLKENYGENDIVARAYTDQLKNGPCIKESDVDGIVALARDMVNCDTVLSRMHFSSDLNSSGTIRDIVKRLPRADQAKWKEKALNIMEHGRLPAFSDLTTFVKYRARAASTMYGRDFAESSRQKPQQPLQEVKKTKARPTARANVSTLSATVEKKTEAKKDDKGRAQPQQSLSKAEKNEKPPCLYCDIAGHSIERCFKFKKLTVTERVEAARKQHLCFRCLKKGHGSKNCDKSCSKCQRRHHVLLHDTSRETDKTASEAEKATTTKEATTASTTKFKSSSSFGVLPVRVVGNSKEVRTFALLDSGSNVTLVKRSVVDSLGVKGSSTPYAVNTMAGKSVQDDQMTCQLAVLSDDRTECVDVEALTVSEMPIKNEAQVKCHDWNHLKDLHFSDVCGPIEIIIGTDSTDAHWCLEEIRGGRKEPIARRTPLGWIVLGPSSSSCNKCVNFVQTDLLQQQLERIWSADFQDVRSIDPVMSVDDKTALRHMQDTVHMENGKFHVGIPWRVDPETSLPNNRGVAESRLRMLKRKFQTNPKLAEDYTTTVQGYIADNQARLVSSSEAAGEHQWFLPHHAVFKKSNPSKCRVVFDCAAEYKGVSLNDIIHQGPNFLNNLAGVLLRFRREPVAVVGDIKCMFHQCFVLPTDQRFLRFLWWPDGDVTKDAQVYAMKVHLFGGKSSPSVVNFCMRKIADDNEADFSEEAIDTLRRSFYMDDMIRSVDSVDAAKKLIPDMMSLLERGGFKLGKFMSTHREVIDTVPEDLRAKSLQELPLEDSTLPQESALGLQWNVEGDFFTYTFDLKDKPATRRGLLGTTASLYDPLGLVAPVTLVPKLMQQELCRLQLDWDDEIGVERTVAVSKWKDATSNLSSIKLPRSFQPGPSAFSDRELHVFCDASELAYGVVAYLKVTSDDGVFISILLGKSRVAPLKTISIPRLELTAATLAAKMSRFIKEELDFEQLPMFFWSDSMTALRYIRNVSTRFKSFVAHRVQQIQDLTDVASWNYVPTDCNPADLASRGINPDDNAKLQFWLKGPQFLRDSTVYDRLFEEPVNDEDDLEVRVSCLAERVMDLDVYMGHFSSFYKLVKSVSWLRKFRQRLQGQDMSPLSPQDITHGTRSLIKFVQHQVFADEFKCLQHGKQLPKSSQIRQLNPLIVGDVLCAGGRVSRAGDEVVKYPIILPQNHHLTTLVIRDVHARNGHVGVNHTLSILRRKFYLIRGYSKVKSVLQRCVPCKKHHGKPLEQKMADLPPERLVTTEPPFTFVGVDYFGPMNVKFRRGSTKRYGCLFTCLVTRAVHIEIAHKLDSDSFLMAFHRFMARRGKPQKVFSDNGTNFVAANKELADEIANINNKKLEDEMLVQAVEWSFNPPHAPHMGGVWERLVRSVKSIFRHLVHDRLLTDEELMSFMCEAEKIINDRPLTKMGSDADDPTPLTPSHLLLLRDNTSTSNTEANYVRRRWQVVQAIANNFFSRFVSEYIPELQLRQKWCDSKNNLRVHDIVLVADEDLPRGQWPLGLVEDIELSSDGLVRAASVRVKNSLKRRPVNKLVLLEHHQ